MMTGRHRTPGPGDAGRVWTAKGAPSRPVHQVSSAPGPGVAVCGARIQGLRSLTDPGVVTCPACTRVLSLTAALEAALAAEPHTHGGTDAPECTTCAPTTGDHR